MIVSTFADAVALSKRIAARQEKVCGIDCETEGIDPRKEPAAGPKGRIVCWTLSFDEEDHFIWATPDTWWHLGPLLWDLPVVGHNIWGFDAHMFRKAGAPLGIIVADTMRMSKQINPTEGASHGLKSLMKWHLGIEPVGDFMELFTRKKMLEEKPPGELKITKRKVGEFLRIPTLLGGACSRVGSITEPIPLSTLEADYPHLLPILYKYALLDSRATLELYRRFKKKMEETPWEVPLMGTPSTQAGGTRHAG